jgi:hypothetical protein
MLIKALLSSLGCLLAWVFLLPVFALVGGAGLFLYATLAEIGSLFTGRTVKTIDPSTARENARRICMGYRFTRT